VRTATRFSAVAKAELLALVTHTRERTGWTVRRILHRLGLARSTYREWVARSERAALADRRPVAPALDAILPEETAAVLRYALAHPKDGYRRLTWQMVDADVAYLSPSSVYRVLNDADLLYRWKRAGHAGERPAAPTAVHERWHTDIMYLRVGDVWYFLVTVLDAYSRYVVHWELLTSMTALDVRYVMQHALEQTRARPRIVTDNGAQFTAVEFKDLVRRFALEHIRIRTYHPESNGLVERFHRSTREALGEAALRTFARAQALIGAWVAEYNDVRLHAGLGYLTPAEYYRGDPVARRQERQAKLVRGRAERRRRNRERGDAAA
jgi:transposase InsO family protein